MIQKDTLQYGYTSYPLLLKKIYTLIPVDFKTYVLGTKGASSKRLQVIGNHLGSGIQISSKTNVYLCPTKETLIPNM